MIEPLFLYLRIFRQAVVHRVSQLGINYRSSMIYENQQSGKVNLFFQ